MKTVNQYCFEAITGYGGSAATDGWQVASKADLADWAHGHADFAEDCEGTLDTGAVADAVIWIRENHKGQGTNWDRTYSALGN